MKIIFFFILFFCAANSYSQKKSNLKDIEAISRMVASIDTQKNILLTKCDSIPDDNNVIPYRCWNFYFTDSSKKWLCKFTFSYEGFTEWVYYYKNNNVIKVQHNKFVKGTSKFKWTIYFKDEKSIYSAGDFETEAVDQIGEATYFKQKAFDFANKK